MERRTRVSPASWLLASLLGKSLQHLLARHKMFAWEILGNGLSLSCGLVLL